MINKERQKPARNLTGIKFNLVIENKFELGFYKNLAQNITDFLEINGPATFEEIIEFVGGSDRRTVRMLNEMVNLDTVNYRKRYFFAKNPRSYPLYSGEVLCTNCQGKLVGKKTRVHVLLNQLMKKISAKRPQPTFVFDQRPVTLETTINRALYATWRGDLHSKRIAVIGDDDLTSLAIGFLGIVKEIVVFEIDRRLNKFIREINARLGDKINPSVRVVSLDVLKGIPERFRHRFDVFMTDPTPNPLPFVTFVNAGIELLKRGAGGIGYLSIYPSHTPKTIEFQKELTSMNLIITDSIPFFTNYTAIPETYSPADKALLKKFSASKTKIGFFESLLRIETTAKTKLKQIQSPREQFLGTATKRVLKEPMRDPAMQNEPKSRSYLLSETKRLIRNKHRKSRTS